MKDRTPSVTKISQIAKNYPSLKDFTLFPPMYFIELQEVKDDSAITLDATKEKPGQRKIKLTGYWTVLATPPAELVELIEDDRLRRTAQLLEVGSVIKVQYVSFDPRDPNNSLIYLGDLSKRTPQEDLTKPPTCVISLDNVIGIQGKLPE